MVATDFSSIRTDSTALRPGRRGILARLFAAVMDSRQRKADRDIAEILSWHADGRPPARGATPLAGQPHVGPER